jgi:hypothetical protein
MKKEYYPFAMQKDYFNSPNGRVDIAYNLAQVYIIEGEVNRTFEQHFKVDPPA